MANVQIFLSAVSAEFGSYRDHLRHDLDGPNVTVKIQEDFIATGSETLDKLDDYIRKCDAVIHLVGDMTGAPAQPPSVAVIRQRYPDFATRFPVLEPFLKANAPALSYTQWEAWLALYHGKTLFIAAPASTAPRDERYMLDENQIAVQKAHLARLASVERYSEIHFGNPDRLAVGMLRSRLREILARAGVVTRPINLRYSSIGPLFKGRDDLIESLSAIFRRIPSAPAVSVVAALIGMGGVGKSRAALEYAWGRSGGYTALLFSGADSPETLQRNLAALCGPTILNLPEQMATDETKQCNAVLQWLRQHHGWLLILDNVDSEDAAQAVEALLPKVPSGHLLLTSRLTNWSGGVTQLSMDVLSLDAAGEFLLTRTQAKRRRSADDPVLARKLAEELGQLPLALEQAGAYIAVNHLSFAQYMAEWQSRREKVLAWFDSRLMNYPKSLAITWQTSFDRLSSDARRLLQRLSWLYPAPIPESLLAVKIPEIDASKSESVEAGGLAALAELEAHSLVKRASDTPSFSIHRLVQEVTRQSQRGDPRLGSLIEAVRWINDAFIGKTDDVRAWPVLNPLAPHARAVTAYADAVSILEPTARLMNQVSVLLMTNALHREAEPLMRRVLEISETSLGTDHPRVAICLNNLAMLLQTTNRLAEAEQLMRRALEIDDASFGPDHPTVARDLSNLATLLLATNRLAEAEFLMRRALAIDEASFGPDHTEVAGDLNNLAQLLQTANRLTEAEPLMRHALEIEDASFGPDHPNVARDLSNLAILLQDTNRMDEAEPLMRRALEIDEASFGSHHPNVATRLNNLAQLLQATNRLDEAEPPMRRALKIDKASFGPDHPDVARDLSNLALLLQATNRLDEAEPPMRDALSIDEASFGSHHPNVAIRLNNLALLLHNTGRNAEAEPLMRRALEIFRASLGAEHPNTLTVSSNYDNLLQAIEAGK